MPTLLYLPNLTPLSESVELLPSTYDALIILCDARFPPTTKGEKEKEEKGNSNSPETQKKERSKFLDRVMRKGVLAGYSYAMEHPDIVAILTTYLRTLTEKMGIESVKHLKVPLTPVMFPLFPSFNLYPPSPSLLSPPKTQETLKLTQTLYLVHTPPPLNPTHIPLLPIHPLFPPHLP